MKKEELLNRINNRTFDKECIFGVEIFEINRNKPVKYLGDESQYGFTKAGFMAALLEALPESDLIYVITMLGEVIVLIDKLPNEEQRMVANDIFFDIVPVSVLVEVHNVDYDPKLLIGKRFLK